MINDNPVFGYLRKRGYKVVAFPIGLTYVEMTGADDFHKIRRSSFTPFEEQFYSATVFSELEALLKSTDAFWLHRARLNNILQNVPYRKNGEEPCFVISHIICPHPPFVRDKKWRETIP